VKGLHHAVRVDIRPGIPMPFDSRLQPTPHLQSAPALTIRHSIGHLRKFSPSRHLSTSFKRSRIPQRYSMPPLSLSQSPGSQHHPTTASLLVLVLLLVNITFAASLQNSFDVAEALRARQDACKSLNNCPSIEKKSVERLNELPWQATPAAGARRAARGRRTRQNLRND
jgi:hypothetical protein